MNNPCPAPISVVSRITEKCGFTRPPAGPPQGRPCSPSGGSERRERGGSPLPRHHIVERRIRAWRLRLLSIHLERIVGALELVGMDAALGLAPREVMVRRMRSPLGHQGVPGALADRRGHD